MTARPAPPRLGRALRLAMYGAFYRLPSAWRRRLVRLGTAGYTVGAVVLVHDDDAPAPGRLLLLRQPPGPGWSIPGGLLQRGEPPIVGAARELAEETGLRVHPELLQPAVPNAVVHSRGLWIDMVYHASVPADSALRIDEAEVHEAAWYPLDALPPLTRATAQLLAHYGIGPLADRPEDD